MNKALAGAILAFVVSPRANAAPAAQTQNVQVVNTAAIPVVVQESSRYSIRLTCSVPPNYALYACTTGTSVIPSGKVFVVEHIAANVTTGDTDIVPGDGLTRLGLVPRLTVSFTGTTGDTGGVYELACKPAAHSIGFPYSISFCDQFTKMNIIGTVSAAGDWGGAGQIQQLGMAVSVALEGYLVNQ